jgi:hypothetical protein
MRRAFALRLLFRQFVFVWMRRSNSRAYKNCVALEDIFRCGRRRNTLREVPSLRTFDIGNFAPARDRGVRDIFCTGPKPSVLVAGTQSDTGFSKVPSLQRFQKRRN